ncbi:MAG: hypothetical protein Q7S45_04235 [Candidatus Curtissbacteria bacterium]|nr:hypothetical protein [Candidatus Curtissbacteria bacterium]
MKKLTQERLLLSLFIILVSIIYGLPHIKMIHKLGSKYNPIGLSEIASIPKDKAYAYAPYVNYIAKGNFPLRETYVYEYKDSQTPYIGETLPATLLAILSKVTGSIPMGFLAADFIFPPIIFVMLYLVARLFIKNHLFALSAAFLAVILRDLVFVIPYPHATFQYLTDAENQQQFLHYSRAFHPQVSFFFFIMSVFSLLKLVSNPNKKIAVLLGIFFGLQFYSYLFDWTYFSVFFSVIFIFFLVKKDFKIIKSMLIAGTVAAIIGSFYFINGYQFSRLDIAQDFIRKMTGQSVPFPIATLRFLLIAALFFISKKRRDNKFITLFLFLLTGVAMVAISKFVIGRDLETFHYLRRALVPFATVSLFIIVYNIIARSSKRIIFTLSIAAIAITLFTGIRTQVIATNVLSPWLIYDHDQVNLFSFLKEHTPKDSVIGTLNIDLNYLIPVYTNNRIYFPPTLRTITPTYEEVDRYIILANLLGLDSKWQKKSLDTYLFYMFHAIVYSTGGETSKVRNQTEEKIQESADNWVNSSGKYRLDYLIVTASDSNIKPDLRFLHPLTTVDKYTIFTYLTPRK